MSGDWTLLRKAAVGLLSDVDGDVWQVLSGRSHARQALTVDEIAQLGLTDEKVARLTTEEKLALLTLTDDEISRLADLNSRLSAMIRFKFREGAWQVAWSKPGATEPQLLPDFWRQQPVSIDPFGQSVTWLTDTFHPILVRDAKATGKRATHKDLPVPFVTQWIINHRVAAWSYDQAIAKTCKALKCSPELAREAFGKVEGRRRRGEHMKHDGHGADEEAVKPGRKGRS